MIDVRNENIIYKATNVINGKMYIGYCVSFKNRKNRHLKCAEKGIVTKFYNAIRKYGKDNFTWDILEDNVENINKLKEREVYYIKHLNTYNDGYNSTLGGDGGFTGHNSGQFKKGMKPWCTGIKLSEEHIEKLKIADRTLSYKPVLQFDMNDNYIREFSSLKEAMELTKVNKQYISNVCKKHKGFKSAGGYKWKFKNN